jgi:hypothetical protein
LTASSCLKHLSISADVELPDDGWYQLLGTGLQQGGSNLQSLSIAESNLDLMPGTGTAGLSYHGCLLSLSLTSCHVDLDAISALTQLTFLNLACVIL